ncbi:MAG: 2-succinyl-6-hydroxy-2,4-cyclohexadiene-1-carboxylate synthase [Candidatus Marinimicrobia bacterium]|nr:2-succinyl-6-hydroxy-2,4-cyclohexadiene-1-carboxylate synthase [Candidatus Neomarinimicrobiota bacterium]
MNLPDPLFEWNFRRVGKDDGTILLWLHGFLGSGADWLDLVKNHFSDYCNIMVDLPGHGQNAIPAEVEFSNILESLVKQLELAGVEKFIPIGYSMGGRLAFHLHHYIPERIQTMIFLSSAPGLKSNIARQERIIQDQQLMTRLERTGFSAFLPEWYSAGLFGNIKLNSLLFSQLCQDRSKNDVSQLRQALELMGNGALPSLWGSLKEISVPTLLLSGEKDSKYFQLNQEMNQLLPDSMHLQVSDAGHAFHLEKPLETARLIRHFLSETIEGE